jgi:hypothetical protein
MITLNIHKQTDGISWRTQAWGVKIEIVDSSRTNTNKLFRINFLDGKHYFSGVASPVDLLELPTEPDEDSNNSFWLTDKVDLLMRCESDLDEVIRLVKIELDELDRSLKASESITSSTEVIGD